MIPHAALRQIKACSAVLINGFDLHSSPADDKSYSAASSWKMRRDRTPL